MTASKVRVRKPARPRAEVQSAVFEAGDIESGWLVAGKLAPPEQRINAAERVTLLARLDSGLDRAASLIVSPPGFGKTTLLTQWWHCLLSRSDVVPCWLTVDELDSEVSRFTAGLILSATRAGIDVGQLEVIARQQSIDPNVRPVVLALLSAMRRCGRRVVLVLDDFHRARSDSVADVLQTLVDQGTDAVHVVASGRQRPALQVSALRARGLVTLIEAPDLTLSLEEAGEVMGGGISQENLKFLHERTEGWAVALQLARLWLERGAGRPEHLREFSGRTAEVTEYLAEQVIADLPDDLREFLLETALLDRFDASLADKVRGRDDSVRMLERLRCFDALLVPLDGSRDWFRYHRLIADFLTQRLRRTAPAKVVELHRRAARSLALAGDLPEAVRHALGVADVPLAVALTEEAGGWQLILTRGIGYVRSLLDAFSDSTVRAEPTLRLTRAYLAIKLGRFDEAREMLAPGARAQVDGDPRRARDYHIVQSLWRLYMDDLADPAWITPLESSIDRLEADDHLGRATLHSGVAVAALALGQVARADVESRRAIHSMRAAGSVLGTNYIFLHLAQSQLLRGQLREAESLFRDSVQMAEDNFGADSGLTALSYAFLAYCMYLRGDLVAARRMLARSSETTDGWLDVFATTFELRMRIALVDSSPAEALRVIASAAATARQRHLGRLASLVAAWRVEVLTVAGRLGEASREAAAEGLHEAAEHSGPIDFTWRARLAATIAVARLRVARGQAATALQLVERARVQFRQAGLLLPAYRLDALGAAILKARGQQDEAVARIQSLLDYAVSEGAGGLLLEHGAALESLLYVIQRRNRELILSGPQRALVTSILELSPGSQRNARHGFTSRELEVLRELCNGKSNKAIGHLLDLSENTVKFHLKRIFKKLGTDSRTAAIAAALHRGVVFSEDTTADDNDQ